MEADSRTEASPQDWSKAVEALAAGLEELTARVEGLASRVEDVSCEVQGAGPRPGEGAESPCAPPRHHADAQVDAGTGSAMGGAAADGWESAAQAPLLEAMLEGERQQQDLHLRIERAVRSAGQRQLDLKTEIDKVVRRVVLEDLKTEIDKVVRRVVLEERGRTDRLLNSVREGLAKFEAVLPGIQQQQDLQVHINQVAHAAAMEERCRVEELSGMLRDHLGRPEAAERDVPHAGSPAPRTPCDSSATPISGPGPAGSPGTPSVPRASLHAQSPVTSPDLRCRMPRTQTRASSPSPPLAGSLSGGRPATALAAAPGRPGSAARSLRDAPPQRGATVVRSQAPPSSPLQSSAAYLASRGQLVSAGSRRPRDTDNMQPQA
mmetsp:Transcript_119958/g.373599  ORF Transcript_119958/g.373599 Transcript_119958/m.373599 type:complete len:378 (-) Transcript_119958:240-1373(-)